MIIDEMVDTSKDSEVKPIHPVSPRYQPQLNHEGIRLEIPYAYAMKSGLLYKEEVIVYEEDNALLISCLHLDTKTQPNYLPTYYYKIGGNPMSEQLDELTCSVFIAYPSNFFNIGDKIRYEYQSEKQTGTERHVKCSLC